MTSIDLLLTCFSNLNTSTCVMVIYHNNKYCLNQNKICNYDHSLLPSQDMQHWPSLDMICNNDPTFLIDQYKKLWCHLLTWTSYATMTTAVDCDKYYSVMMMQHSQQGVAIREYFTTYNNQDAMYYSNIFNGKNKLGNFILLSVQ